MKKIKEFILRWLGIDTILVRLKRMDNLMEAYERKLRENHRFVSRINDDNKVILGHLEFINSNFFATADISGCSSKYSTNTIIIVRKNTHGKDEISYYEIQTRDVNQVMDIIRGFGHKNTFLDTPKGFPINPKFRY
ncbi:hypothetical protein ACTS9V_06715 [Empedobacter falsenii]